VKYGALELIDNFNNLLELPILFYVVCIALYVTDTVSGFLVILAWLFVVLRATHSLIHVTYNHVVQRWLAYIAGAVALAGLWIGFAIALYG